MKLRPYQPGDEDRFDARSDFAQDYLVAGGFPDGPKFTVLQQGEPVGIAGFSYLGDGQRGAWAYMAALSRVEWLLAARKAREVLSWVQPLIGCDVYATPADTDAAQRLLAYIGFRPSPDDAGVWKFMPEAA